MKALCSVLLVLLSVACAGAQSTPMASAHGLAAGNGITITDGAITNAGVTTLAAGSSNLTLSAATGTVTVDMAASPAVTSMTIGGGTALTKMAVYAPSLTPSQIAAAIGTVAQTFAVTGISTADKLFVNPASVTALCPVIAVKASATDQITLYFSNLTVALCTPASGTYTILAVRS